MSKPGQVKGAAGEKLLAQIAAEELFIASGGLIGRRMRKLIARVGREEIDRRIETELIRRLEPFENAHLTPDVQRAIRDAIVDGLGVVARDGADA